MTLRWLLQWWDIGASSQESEGKEVQQLASLAKDKVIDKRIGKNAGVLRLQWWLLSSVKERWPLEKSLQIPEANGPIMKEASSIWGN